MKNLPLKASPPWGANRTGICDSIQFGYGPQGRCTVTTPRQFADGHVFTRVPLWETVFRHKDMGLLTKRLLEKVSKSPGNSSAVVATGIEPVTQGL
jgi:hypothetical protein